MINWSTRMRESDWRGEERLIQGAERFMDLMDYRYSDIGRTLKDRATPCFRNDGQLHYCVLCTVVHRTSAKRSEKSSPRFSHFPLWPRSPLQVSGGLAIPRFQS